MRKKKKQKTFVEVLFRALWPAVILYVAANVLSFGKVNYFETCVLLSPIFHALGGALMGWMLYVLLDAYHKRLKIKIRPTWLFGLCFVSLIAFIGVWWEVYEFLLDKTFYTNSQSGVADTLLDLVMDIIGAYGMWLLIARGFRPKWLR